MYGTTTLDFLRYGYIGGEADLFVALATTPCVPLLSVAPLERSFASYNKHYVNYSTFILIFILLLLVDRLFSSLDLSYKIPSVVDSCDSVILSPFSIS